MNRFDIRCQDCPVDPICWTDAEPQSMDEVHTVNSCPRSPVSLREEYWEKYLRE